MLVAKVTIGYVIQVFDTDLGRFISQDFIAGDGCDYENEDGEPLESMSLLDADGKEAYLPFDMVDPDEGVD